MLITLPIYRGALLTQLPRYAHSLGILFVSKSQNELYLANDFLKLAFDKSCNKLCNLQFDWMYTTKNKMFYECGLFPIDLTTDTYLICEYIGAMLENGRYCIINLDEYNCQHTKYYCENHHVNDYLVYGINTDTQEFLLCYYSEENTYTETKMHVCKFVSAIDHSKHYFVIHCFKENINQISEPFDWGSFCSVAEEYAQSDMYDDCSDEIVYNLAALNCFINKLKTFKHTERNIIVQSLLSLSEHKTITQFRLSWLCANTFISKEAVREYTPINELAERLYLDFLQYAAETKELSHYYINEKEWESVVSNIVNGLTEIGKKEKQFFSNLTDAIAVKDRK